MYSGSIPDVASNQLVHLAGVSAATRGRKLNAVRVAAVILAGGKGERLGGSIKANLVVGGRTLLQRTSAAVAGSASPLLVAHGNHDPALLSLGPEHIPISDLPADYGGPLAGLAAAIAWCLKMSAPPDFLVSLAVDTPFFPPDFVARALATMGESPAVIARYGGQAYPTDALWRLSNVVDLPARLAAGTAPRSLKRIAEELGAAYLDWLPSDAGDPFANANTPDELEALRARATLASGPEQPS